MKSPFFILALVSLFTFTACQPPKDPDAENFNQNYDGSAGVDDVDNKINNETNTENINTENNADTNIAPETNNNLPINDNNMNSTQNVKVDQFALPEKGEEIVVITTNKGVIKARLFPQATPKTVENFKGLIAKKYYDGIIFHRVIKDFMIQGGDPTGTGMGGESLWGGKFADEFHPDLRNVKGALSMANAGPNTNGSQFFIVQAEATPWLNGLHSVFGQVFEGINIVDAIANLPVGPGDKPVDEVKIESMTLANY